MNHSSLGNWVALIPRVLANHGIDAQPYLTQLGLPPHQSSSGRIPAELTARAWRTAATLSGEPTIGIEAAQMVQPASWDLLGLAMLCSANLQQAISLLIKYAAFISDSVEIYAEEDERHYAICIRSVSAGLPGAESLDFGMATGFQLLRNIFPAQLKLTSLSLTRPPLADASPYQRFYGCEKIEFGQPVNKQVYLRSDIDQPLPYANAELASYHEALLQRQLPVQPTFVHQVADQITAQLAAGEVSQEQVAAQLNISSRHLQRKLKLADTRFSELVETIKRKQALHYIRENNRPLTEIAHLLGFSDHSNFTRAFKRWYGTTPKQFLRH